MLLEAGRHAEAERVYLADLERYPRNGWSLHGLSKALIGQGKSKRAAAVQARFEKAWERADIPMRSSCLCVMPGSS